MRSGSSCAKGLKLLVSCGRQPQYAIARAWNRNFAEHRTHSQLVLTFAVLQFPAGRAVLVQLQAFGDLMFDHHALDLVQNRFAFGQCQTQRLQLEFGSFEGSDVVLLLLSVVRNSDEANLEVHAASWWPVVRNFRLISRRSQRRG